MNTFLQTLFFGFPDRRPINSRKLLNLKKHVYKGDDQSILSNYVLCHFWNWIINWIPLWMAPNLITFIGLSIIICVFFIIVFHYYQHDMLVDPYSWHYILFGLSLFFYNTLDAIDGKQARRTGSSNPLGQIFDHGCDALNLLLIATISPILIRVKVDFVAMAMILSTSVTFFVASWDEYYTKVLYLPPISGPIEGNFGYVILCLLIPITGTSIWNYKVKTGIFEFPLNYIFVYSTICFTVGTCLASFFNVLRAKKSLKPFLNLIPIMIYYCTCLWIFLDPEFALGINWILFTLITGIPIVCSVGLVILAYCSRSSFPFWTSSFLPVLTLLIRAMIKPYYTLSVSLTKILLSLLGVSLLSYFYLVFCAIRQITKYLNISCFTIPYDTKSE